MKKISLSLLSLLIFFSCQQSIQQEERSPIVPARVSEVIDLLVSEHGSGQATRIERGVEAAATLWRTSDGSTEDFKTFCLQHYMASEQERDMVFDRLAHYFEHLQGYMNRITLELNRQIHEDRGPIHLIDQLFGSYSPSAHIQDDFFNNKIAFIIALNFPSYSLDEKNESGSQWSKREWGMARLGDIYTARIPPRLLQERNQVYSDGRLYISEYNIYAGKLLDEKGNTPFPQGMKLLAHWNIRDEIRSNYGQENGINKQELLYQVMLRIIGQDIPQEVINNNQYLWNPLTNTLYDGEKTVAFKPEGVVRYQHLLNNFIAIRNIDPYHSELNTYIKRHFEGSMEIPRKEVEALFREYAASPLLREVAQLISQRLGRELRPYDLWYDGFKGRSGISEEDLDKITKSLYPNATALNRDLPRILRELGFSPQDADFIAERIDVDPARGSGHAWRASMRSKPSHLRTRIGADGMDYKGYNIAIHEFGHNVEQTISVHMTDNYFINGIPNTAFTEALAFMFQRRDMEFLGMKQDDPRQQYLEVLDIFWDNFEMMGVSLVDMQVWEWMYNNPQATAEQLKEAAIQIATEVWNEYYADVFGERDTPILAIYSHMIQSPLYLSNYPYGRLIMFQLEEYIQNKDFAEEVLRIYSLGRLTPQHWMQQAVGEQISNQPIFAAVRQALDAMM
jgi:hypothetical protein